MIIGDLKDRGVLQIPDWLTSNIQYVATTGSVAYGCNESESDEDLVCWCIPLKEMIFPYLGGEIEGFGTKLPRFVTVQETGLVDKTQNPPREYDITIYSIVDFFRLCSGSNPNMIDVLFTPARCVRHCSRLGEIVRQNRSLFLSKRCYRTFANYASQQLHLLDKDKPKSNRVDLIERFGYDVKFAYHIIRLMLECDQLLTEGVVDLDKNSEIFKSIRRGEWKKEDLRKKFTEWEYILLKDYENSKLPEAPDMVRLKSLLLTVLEDHYGSLDSCLKTEDMNRAALVEISQIIKRSGYL